MAAAYDCLYMQHVTSWCFAQVPCESESSNSGEGGIITARATASRKSAEAVDRVSSIVLNEAQLYGGSRVLPRSDACARFTATVAASTTRWSLPAILLPCPRTWSVSCPSPNQSSGLWAGQGHLVDDCQLGKCSLKCYTCGSNWNFQTPSTCRSSWAQPHIVTQCELHPRSHVNIKGVSCSRQVLLGGGGGGALRH